jgi:hypothetical protein
MNDQELKEKLSEIKSKTKIQQITVSRIVKSRNGDVFVSLNGSYPVEEDNALSIKEARMATHLLGLEANLLAHEQACASNVISFKEFQTRTSEIKESFLHLLKNKG